MVGIDKRCLSKMDPVAVAKMASADARVFRVLDDPHVDVVTVMQMKMKKSFVYQEVIVKQFPEVAHRISI